MGITAGEIREFGRVSCICLLWYFVSSCNGVFGKWILTEFQHPFTITLVQLLSITIFIRPVCSFLRIRPMSNVSWRYYTKLVIPLAIAKFLSSVLAHVSIWKVPVSYAHTVKATMPFFTVIISRVFCGERFSFKTYMALLPVVLGVSVATLTEVSFDMIGLTSALLATAGFSAMTIVTKKIRDETGVHTIRLLLVTAQLSLFMFLPVWFFVDFQEVIRHPLLTAENSSFSIVLLLVIDGMFHTLQNLLAFTLMNIVSPLTYSVANVSKRIVIITFSIFMLKNHVTSMNFLGIIMSIVGVGLYNKVKYDEKRAKELPTSMKHQNNNNTSSYNRTQPKVNLWNNNGFTPRVKLAMPADYSRLNGSYNYQL